ncbi:hypothetical protein MMC18_009443 [Xylographa bjoerkii]|nr:hypothetical protein [Xylographa bjoerkii]
MAPYVMTVELRNETEYPINWVGASTLKGLDGHTSVGSLTVQPHGTGEIPISKSGGTDGLFTALTWWVGSVHWDKKYQFSVWSMMPASAGGEVSVGLANVDGMSSEQFQTSSWADDCRQAGKKIPCLPECKMLRNDLQVSESARRVYQSPLYQRKTPPLASQPPLDGKSKSKNPITSPVDEQHPFAMPTAAATLGSPHTLAVNQDTSAALSPEAW